MFDATAAPTGMPERRRKPWAGPRERRSAPSPTPRDRRVKPREGVLREGAIHVEALDMSAARLHRAEWARLAARAAEPNPFFEPDFILPAARQLVGSRRPTVLVARKRIDGRMRMIGALPLAPSTRLGAFGPARAWRDPLMALGAPLLDRDYAVEAFSAFLGWVGEIRPYANGLALNMTPRNGAAAAAMRRAAHARAVDFVEFEDGARAALHAGADLDQMVSSSRRKQMRRMARKLAELGKVETRIVSGADVEEEMEAFFTLEASGWKGRRRTALASSIRTLALARGFLRGLSREGRVKIASLELDGAPVAAAVLVYSGGTAFYWKIAYDERFSDYSPGALLMVELSRLLLADPDFTMLDSCTLPGERSIEAIWKGRRRMADMLVGGPGLGFTIASEIETARRGLRAGAKKAYHAAKGLLSHK